MAGVGGKALVVSGRSGDIGAGHVLRLTLSEHGIEAKVECLADPNDFGRSCTYMAAGVYPCTTGTSCMVADSCNEVALDEMLSTFDGRIDLAPIPVAWEVERERPGEGYALIWPEAVTGASAPEAPQ